MKGEDRVIIGKEMPLPTKHFTFPISTAKGCALRSAPVEEYHKIRGLLSSRRSRIASFSDYLNLISYK